MSAEQGDHFRKWLRVGMTGCGFASTLASRGGGIAIEAHAVAPSAAALNDTFDAHARSERSVIVVLPYINDEPGLVALLDTLCRESPRWQLRERGTTPSGASLVGLDWMTANGDVSDAMGFAPSPLMPVTRRAPYVAIGAWPGGRANGFRGVKPTPRARPGQVSFLDAAHDFDEAQYAKKWTGTEATVAALMRVPPDDPRRYRQVAFVVSEAGAAALAFGRGAGRR